MVTSQVFKRGLQQSGILVLVLMIHSSFAFAQELGASVRVRHIQDGGAEVIESVPLETYVAGVVASELPAHWPMATLEDQAVAARTYVLQKKIERKQWNYDVEASILDQMYHPSRSKWPRAQQAAQATAGQVLLTENRDLFPVYFHADCGGQTEVSQNVWGGNSSGQVSVPCPLEASAPWKLELSLSDASKKLARGLGLSKSVRLMNIWAAERSASSRIVRVGLQFSMPNGKTETRDLDANDFRRLLGFFKVKSAWFDWKISGTNLKFSGRGFGHGVGLCQHGARRLAILGYSTREILKHYFPNGLLEKWPGHSTILAGKVLSLRTSSTDESRRRSQSRL